MYWVIVAFKMVKGLNICYLLTVRRLPKTEVGTYARKQCHICLIHL